LQFETDVLGNLLNLLLVLTILLFVVGIALGFGLGHYSGKKSVIDKLRMSRKLSEEDIKLLE
jgi:uncharacterized protein YneF (UPF0154 family)